MIIKIYWLFMSFLYGLFSLFVLTDVYTSGYLGNTYQNDYSNRWTVGQIMPVALLAVPFINVVEMLYHGKATTSSSYYFITDSR